MEAKISSNFMYVTSSKKLWSEITERYGESNCAQIYQLKCNLSAIVQNNLPVAEYYGQLKSLWDEIDSLDGLPTCNCGILEQCTCAILKHLLERDTRDKLMQFLLGLNDGFDNIRTNILAMDPTPNLNKAFSLIQQAERQKQITGAINASQEVNALTTSKTPAALFVKNKDNKKDKTNRRCSHCNIKGHTVEQCFKIIGYPDWYDKLKGKKSVKVAAQANDISSALNDPFESGTPSPTGVDVNLMQTIYQEVMKSMKNNRSSGESSTSSLVNFAGPYY